ncbi:DMT family transporter [Priestia taiwanensis]|uniref:Multidrug DMT transporter permease n=1 Tax=Priestia taiwanensis TaxID=1347902 RepID=A0A917ELT6_9BACI|nr:EamA family transporter [Priestia taiwanensis]MBM7362107.1 drug/metabolite transporter (DMT)-like permease [Priestia taiwanensis]GGE59534.1 multidrug DMT transporter permease [Priestia taiwanensis]
MISIVTRIHVHLLFCLLAIIGGTTWAFQKTGLEDSLPLWSASMRFLLASLLIAFFLCITKKIVVSKEVVMISGLNGLMYFAIPFGSVYWASVYLPSGLVSVLAASISVFALFINRLFKGTPATKGQKIGVAFCLIGMSIVFGNQLLIKGDLIQLVAMGIILVAMLGSAFVTVYVQSRIKSLPIMTFTSFSMLSGGVFLLVISLIIEDGNRGFSGISLISLLYLAIVGSVVGFSLNMYLLKKWHISKATAHLFISPIIALYVGFVFLNETLHNQVYVGTLCVLVGVILINLKKKVEKQTKEHLSETSKKTCEINSMSKKEDMNVVN